MLHKKLLRTTALMALVVTLGLMNAFAGTVIVNSNITTNTTWTNSNVYILVGYIYVTNGAQLTINPGTIIQGDSATLGSLIITRGSKIHAVGTACQPIVFTSEKPAGARKRGDWGGVILLGYAAVNWPGDTGHIEGIVPNPNTLYGGGKNPNFGNTDHPVNTDNSGIMEYVRIEFAGVALSPNNEINGLTFGGVGNGTTIDHIQVSYSNDDSYEWFGGHVDCKYIIAYDGIDDDFDTDNGYSGRVQFALGMRDPNVADVSGSKSFESDNDPTGDASLPVTHGIFANVTALGGSSNNSGNPLFIASAHTRRNSFLKIYNTIMMGFPLGILIDGDNPGASTICNYADTSEVQNCYVQQALGNYYSFTPTTSSCQAQATTNLTSSGNVFSTQYSGVLNSPDFPISNVQSNMTPASGNPLPAANNSLYGGDPFFTNTTYIGAFNPDGSSNWAGDWTNFDPVNTVYGTKVNYTPSVAVTSTTPVICPNSGAADITPSGGISPYVYSWSNGATTQDLSGVAKGNYTITLYDAGHACSVSKNVKITQTLPILTSCTPTSSSVTVFWSGNLAGHVTGYQVRSKKHSVSSWGAWVSAGNGNSFTVSGLISNTSYDFQLRGNCTGGAKTGNSATLTCSTTLKLAGEEGSDAPSVAVYPNPTSGEFKVELNGFASGSTLDLKVTNVLGQVVYNENGISSDNSTLEVNLNDQPEGLYSLEVSDGTNRYVQNVILNK